MLGKSSIGGETGNPAEPVKGLGKSSIGQETGNPTELVKGLGSILSTGQVCHGRHSSDFCHRTYRDADGSLFRSLELHSSPWDGKTPSPRAILAKKKWNPYMNWRKGLSKFQINCSSQA